MEFPKISLEAARTNAKLTQREAAQKIGVSVATLQNYESGKTFPNCLIIEKIEATYQIPAKYIFFNVYSAQEEKK